MAQRGAWTPQKVRDRIKTSMLVKRLEDHILNDAEMSKSQVTACLGLLKKTLPDLQTVQNTHTGADGGPIVISNVDAEL